MLTLSSGILFVAFLCFIRNMWFRLSLMYCVCVTVIPTVAVCHSHWSGSFSAIFSGFPFLPGFIWKLMGVLHRCWGLYQPFATVNKSESFSFSCLQGVAQGFFFSSYLCQVPNSTEHLKIISFNTTYRECYSIIFGSSVLKKLTHIWNGELDKQCSLEGTECAAHGYPPCHVC